MVIEIFQNDALDLILILMNLIKTFHVILSIMLHSRSVDPLNFETFNFFSLLVLYSRFILS